MNYNFVLSQFYRKLRREENDDMFYAFLYLVDWKSAVDNKKQITNNKWHFDPHGFPIPSKPFILKKGKCYGSIIFTGDEMRVIEHVMSFFRKSDSVDINKMIISTYPSIVSEYNKPIDLIKLSYEYKNLKEAS